MRGRVLVWSVALAVVASLVPAGVGWAQSETVSRVSGSSRVGTAVALSEASYPQGAPVVVLARGDRYPDALAGGPLAVQLGGPLLLADTGGLPSETAAEVARLGASEAVLLGGERALSPAVARDLEAAGVDEVRRIAGADRFSTAAAIAGELRDASTAYVTLGADRVDEDGAVIGEGWPDAVSVAGLAASQGRPILLATTDGVPEASVAALDELGIAHAVMVGGEAALAGAVRDGLAAAGVTVERIAGPDRLATSAQVAAYAVSGGADPGRLWLATAGAFPDALAAGPAAAVDGGVLLLAGGPELEDSGAVQQHLRRWRDEVSSVRLVGGSAVISEGFAAGVRDELASETGPVTTPERVGFRDGYWTYESFELTPARTARVNVASGNLSVRESELTLAGRGGLDVEVSRGYDSRTADEGGDGTMGPGWSLEPAGERVAVDGDDATYVTGGARFGFDEQSDGAGFGRARGLLADLDRRGDGGFNVEYRETEETRVFDADGRLTQRVDRNGSSLAYQYGASGGLEVIVDTRGRKVTLDRGPVPTGRSPG